MTVVLTLLLLLHVALLSPPVTAAPAELTPATPAPHRRKIYAAGSGNDMFSHPETVREVIDLSGLDRPNVLYLGTASYDAVGPKKAQTGSFESAGCNVTSLMLAVGVPDGAAIDDAFSAADVVIVSGGNTLFARDRFVKLGINGRLRHVLDRGAVLAGGSAGGIMWFDGGHSDSMKPLSYKNPPGPVLNPALTREEMMAAWTYMRSPGLGLLPGLFCPHYDKTGENGVARAADFANMLRRHPGEFAIAVDNWAAVSVNGDEYRIISRDEKPGSVGPNGNFTDLGLKVGGRPGVWRLRIADEPQPGTVVRELVPETGSVSDLFQSATYIEPFDGMLDVARAQNPDDGRLPSLETRVSAGDRTKLWALPILGAFERPPVILLVLTLLGVVVFLAVVAVISWNRRMQSAGILQRAQIVIHDELSELVVT